MWQSRTKNDLIIEVWERLDCESVGAVEIEAIATAVEGEYGKAAVDSPMVIARLLADEGAELRHAEIMDLYVRTASNRPYDAAFRNLLDISTLDSTAASIVRLENLRRKYTSEKDREGLRLLRELAIEAKEETARAVSGAEGALTAAEISHWLTIWLQTPEMFASWLDIRRRSAEYRERFG